MKNIYVYVVVIILAVLLIFDNKIDVSAQESEPKIVAENSIYCIGSVSKMYTSVAIMKLAQDGKIELDQPVTNYLPTFEMADLRYKMITPRMLIDHSSGLMGTDMSDIFLYLDATEKSNQTYHNQFLDRLKKQRLKADPGQYKTYCNDGFMLAEILIEEVSGMTYSEYLSKEIIEPLSLKDTFTWDQEVVEKADIEKVVPLYISGHKLPMQKVQSIGSGGIMSSTEDLCKFASLFYSKTGILSRSTVLEMETISNNQLFPEIEGDTQFQYGLGWDCVDTYPYNQYGLKALSKGGATNGYYTNLTVIPELEASIAVTASGGNGLLPQMMAQEILLEVLKEEGLIDEIKPAKEKPNVKAEKIPEELKENFGEYLSSGVFRIEQKNENTITIYSQNQSSEMSVDFAYIGNGEFCSLAGGYFGNGRLLETQNGISGYSIIYFTNEEGNQYLVAKQYSNYAKLGETAIATRIGQKIKRDNSKTVLNSQWEERSLKKYFVCDEQYNSASYLEHGLRTLNIARESKDYIWFDGMAPCKIESDQYAKAVATIPGMIGRDLNDMEVVNAGGKEKLKAGETWMVCEDDLESFSSIGETILMQNDSQTNWYTINQQTNKRMIDISIQGKGAFYVYDNNQNCIQSSILENADSVVGIKEGEYLLLAGNKGTKFSIKKMD